MRYYNIYPDDIELRFLATQYVVSGRSDDIHYQKLIDDTKNLMREDKASQHGDPNSICNAVRKKMFVHENELTDFFVRYARDRDGTYTESEFKELLGTRLQLVPEICTENNLAFLWSLVDERKTNSVKHSVITSYINSNAKSREDLKEDLLKKLGEYEHLERQLSQNPLFMSAG